jgi:hypothetical protein
MQYELKNAVFWDVAPCGCSLQTPAYAGSSFSDFSTLKMEGIRSSETSVHTRSTRRHIPEDGTLHCHRRENLKSYIRNMSCYKYVKANSSAFLS